MTTFEDSVGAEGGLDFSGVAGAAVDYDDPARAFRGFSGNVTAAEQSTLSKSCHGLVHSRFTKVRIWLMNQV